MIPSHNKYLKEVPETASETTKKERKYLSKYYYKN